MEAVLFPRSPEIRRLPAPTLRNMKASVLDGAFAQLMTSLTTGFLLTGFAVALGAREAEVGILAALPALGNLGQLAGPAAIGRLGSRKTVAVRLAAAARCVWIFVLLLPFLPVRGTVWLLAGVGVSSVLGALSGVAWMSWMAEMIPEHVRGRFFGHRNMVAGLVGMAGSWLGGQFVDAWRRGALRGVSGPAWLLSALRVPGAEFSVLFGVAVASGAISLYYLRSIDEVPGTGDTRGPGGTDSKAFAARAGASSRPAWTKPVGGRCSGQGGASGSGGWLWRLAGEPALALQDARFRRLVLFGVAWAFAVGIGGPFIDLYTVRTLQIPFGLLALFGVVNGAFNILGMKVWGEFSDRWGTLPALALSSAGAAVLPLLWVFATPENWGILWAANALSGFSWAGIGLVSSTLLMKMAPGEHSTAYFATYTALTGLAGAVAPAIGGYLGAALSGRRLEAGGLVIGGLQILFVITAAARMVALGLLRDVRPPREPSPEELLGVLAEARMRLVQPVLGAGQWAQYGMATAESLSDALTRGSLSMESRIEAAVRAGEAWIERADTAWARFVDRAEAFMARSIHRAFDRVDAALARVRRWWSE